MKWVDWYDRYGIETFLCYRLYGNVFLLWNRTELCNFSGYKIHPGRGKRVVRTDGKVSIRFIMLRVGEEWTLFVLQLLNFLNSKTEKSFLRLHRNPREIRWTVLYRRKYKKGQQEEAVKKRVRRVVKVQRAIAGASITEITAKRNQKPEVRKAQRDEAIKFVSPFLCCCSSLILECQWSHVCNVFLEPQKIN